MKMADSNSSKGETTPFLNVDPSDKFDGKHQIRNRTEYSNINHEQLIKENGPGTKYVSDSQNPTETILCVTQDRQEENEGGTNSNETVTFSSFSNKSKYMLILSAAAYLLIGMSYSNIAPFYPKEAEKKGMTITTTGFVFSIYEFLIFTSAPFIGKYLTKIGAKFAFISGIFVGGTCTILFGTLDKCPPGTPFIVLSFLCRSIEALGFSCLITSIMTIVSCEFPGYYATTLAILETASGIGTMVGPAVGGLLYELGGFSLPFYSVGVLIIINGLFIYMVFPSPKGAVNKADISMFSLLRSPMVVLPMISMFLCSTGVTFIQPTLAQHLDPFGLSSALVGLVFVICPGMYAFFSLTLGYLIDKKGYQGVVIVFGHAVFSIGMFLAGPSNLFPFIPFELWTIIVGLFLVGFSFGCLSIPPLKCVILGTKELGYKEDINLYGTVSGLVNAMYYLGTFMGPTIGGFLIQEVGYAKGYTVIGMTHLAMVFVTFFYFFTRYLFKKKRTEQTLFSEEKEVLLPVH